MDYFQSAFGGLDPHNDPDAAIKFVLNVILMDKNFKFLAHVLPEDSSIGEIGGDPEWTLERRVMPHAPSAYSQWPAGSRFRAYVDPEGYELAHPECFLDKEGFYRYVLTAIHAYLERNPSEASDESLQLVMRAAVDAIADGRASSPALSRLS
jgi:hypothetical protein